ncbi:hypothetical protein WJX73_003814 [Symbiochloris irregularis]|uniref:Uncharacterized protein n=1 Tax=Symbiochloris irregularis TaxID=706552 RepID=A0AAW1NP95_9CHLO
MDLVHGIQAAAFARKLLHGAGGHDDEEGASSAAAPAGFDPSSDGDADHHQQSTHTLKWIFAAVIFAESLLGVLLPLLIRIRSSWFASPVFLSLLNCFAGGVFLTFGIMHLLPDSAEDAETVGIQNYPTAYLFATVGFFVVFFVQKVLTPLLTPSDLQSSQATYGQGSCCSSGAAVILGKVPQGTMTTQPSGEAPLKEVPLGGPGNCCSDAATDSSAEEGRAAMQANGCECASDNAGARFAWMLWVAPSVLFAGLCIHSVFEGLAVGLQDTNAAVVTVAVAMVSHKWVESLALSTFCIRAGARWWHLLLVLVPFGVMGFVGVAIGVSVTDSSTWAELVLFALIAGGFIYIGGYEIVQGEFSSNCYSGRFSKLYRVAQFVFMFLGALLVALLQMVHGS